jgi:hypothetical protein
MSNKNNKAMKVLIGIRRTSQMAGSNEHSPMIEGQSTEIITTGSEEFIRNFVKEIRELEKELPSLYKEKFEFDEWGWEGKSEKECEEIDMKMTDKINHANSLKKYSTVLLIDGEIL